MTYHLLKDVNDQHISDILAVYKLSSVSPFIHIDEENYWRYVTNTNGVYFYKVLKKERLVAAVHLEFHDCVLSMSIVVFPEYQKAGIATQILNDIQAGILGTDFDTIFVSIDEKNTASIRLFEKAGFVCVSKDEELLEYVYNKKSR